MRAYSTIKRDRIRDRINFIGRRIGLVVESPTYTDGIQCIFQSQLEYEECLQVVRNSNDLDKLGRILRDVSF